jgi:DNA-binding transcriptional LysR family regulator
LRIFVAVANLRGFAAAARRLSISPAQASKLIARLEERLGTRLLNRTTRDVSLTDAGRALQPRAATLVEEFEQLEQSTQESAKPRGLLRLSVPVSFGNELAAPLLDFARAYPDISLDVSATDRIVNLVEEGYDAAVRIGVLADSSLVARRLASVHDVTVAAPAYLKKRGEPKVPQDLAGHDLIIDLNPANPYVWHFGEGARRSDVRVSGRLRFDNPFTCVAAARAGFGIARVPAFAAMTEMRKSKVRALLEDFRQAPIPIHAVYPHARHLPAKIRVFVDFLAGRFAARSGSLAGLR